MTSSRPRTTPRRAEDASGLPPAFSSTKREILLILKREGQADLRSLSEQLGITKMAVHKHAKDLESQHLIERIPVRGQPGRPRLALRLAPSASNLFPKAYAGLTCAALAFVEKRLGREAVEELLRGRQAALLSEYREGVRADSLAERVRRLAALRQRDGYMAESRKGKRGSLEILEYNCPILAVAETYWEACRAETEMFQRVLGARVEASHRVVAGDPVCRFRITPKRPQGDAS